jgi:hypothetical protein
VQRRIRRSRARRPPPARQPYHPTQTRLVAPHQLGATAHPRPAIGNGRDHRRRCLACQNSLLRLLSTGPPLAILGRGPDGAARSLGTHSRGSATTPVNTSNPRRHPFHGDGAVPGACRDPRRPRAAGGRRCVRATVGRCRAGRRAVPADRSPLRTGSANSPRRLSGGRGDQLVVPGRLRSPPRAGWQVWADLREFGEWLAPRRAFLLTLADPVLRTGSDRSFVDVVEPQADVDTVV